MSEPGGWRPRPIVWQLALAAAVVYTLVHVVQSGIITPLARPNIRQVAYEIRPLNAFLATGQPVVLDESDQYGPVFFFVMHPLLRLCGGDAWPLSRCLYGVQLIALAASFFFSWRLLVGWQRERPGGPAIGPAALAGLMALLWLNFSPLYYIVATKGVEMWELALVSGGLYAYQRGRRATAGIAIAAATFIKLLPGLFLLWFLLRDRRALAWAIAGTIGILGVSQAIYGPAMGFSYPLHIARAAVVPAPDAATGRHENLALKNMVVKAFGELPIPRPDQIGDGKTGYSVTIDTEREALANRLGLVLHALALLALLWLWRPGGSGTDARALLWQWALGFVGMLIIAPAATFEYMLLTVPAFGFALTVLVTEPRARRPAVIALVAAALVIVGNIVPRSLVNELLGMRLLRDWAGFSHFTLSETYQYFGIPMFGLLLLAAALILVRERETRRLAPDA